MMWATCTSWIEAVTVVARAAQCPDDTDPQWQVASTKAATHATTAMTM